VGNTNKSATPALERLGITCLETIDARFSYGILQLDEQKKFGSY
jgi:hypothetical protein